jgi:hypothetical protein
MVSNYGRLAFIPWAEWADKRMMWAPQKPRKPRATSMNSLNQDACIGAQFLYQ